MACVDPASILSDLAAAGAPTIPNWLGKVNSFATGPGREPGRGYVLLRFADAATLDLTTDQTLTFSGADTDHIVALVKITLLSSECVSPGSATDPYAAYLFEVVDRRHLDGMIPLDRGFNVSKADGSAFFTQTLNSSTPWTWQEVVQEIATALDYGVLDLPFAPDGAPENLTYFGVPSALSALCDVLARIACDLAYDPITDEFTVVRLGDPSDTKLTDIAAGRTWDGYSSLQVRGWMPQYLRVRFVRHPMDFSTGFSPFWFEDIALADAAGVQLGTYVQIDDDLTALGSSGTPTNSTNLATRAAERAADWFRKRTYYDRPVLRAWRDFIPTAAGLGAYAVQRVVFDDRGGLMQTWAHAGPDRSLERWRPLANLPPWYPLAAPGSSTPTELSSCSSVLANLTTTDCVLMEIVSTGGSCSGIDATQKITLKWDTDKWKSGSTDWTGTGSGGTGQVTYDPSGTIPAAVIDGVSGKYLGCDGAGGAMFAFGGSVLCGGTATECDPGFTVTFRCHCCPLSGWTGDGWYCVLQEGGSDCETDPQEVLEITTDNNCASSGIIICSGPYATEAEALLFCGPPAAPLVLSPAHCASKTFLTRYKAGLYGVSDDALRKISGCGIVVWDGNPPDANGWSYWYGGAVDVYSDTGSFSDPPVACAHPWPGLGVDVKAFGAFGLRVGCIFDIGLGTWIWKSQMSFRCCPTPCPDDRPGVWTDLGAPASGLPDSTSSPTPYAAGQGDPGNGLEIYSGCVGCAVYLGVAAPDGAGCPPPTGG